MWKTEKKKAQERAVAIDILTKQIGKLDDSNYPASEIWAVQTRGFIKKFFGKDSPEYEYIKNFKVLDEWKKPERWNNKEKGDAKLFLNQCIQSIQRTGLNDEGKNILTSLSNQALLSWSSLFLIGFFWFAYYVGNITSNNERHELKDELRTANDSLKIYSQSIKNLNAKLKIITPARPTTPNQKPDTSKLELQRFTGDFF